MAGGLSVVAKRECSAQHAQATTQTSREDVPEDPYQRLDRRQFGCQSVLFVQEQDRELPMTGPAGQRFCLFPRKTGELWVPAGWQLQVYCL